MKEDGKAVGGQAGVVKVGLWELVAFGPQLH